MKRLFAIILLCASFAQAADPTPVPATRKPFQLPLADGHVVQAVLLPGPQGQILVVYSYNNAIITGTLVIDGEPGPQPPEPPQPPVPPPPPAPTKIQVVVVEETGDSDVTMAGIRESKAIREYCEKGGHKIFFLDKDSKDRNGKPPAAYAPWLDLATKKPSLPWVFITKISDNTAVVDQALPMDEAKVLELLKKYGG